MNEAQILKAYELAKERYAAIGVDTDNAVETLEKTPISLHCWQTDDVIGFESAAGLSGGIQTTGNYPGRARNIKFSSCIHGTAAAVFALQRQQRQRHHYR